MRVPCSPAQLGRVAPGAAQLVSHMPPAPAGRRPRFRHDAPCDHRYRFDIVDAWKDHTPRPFRSMPDTYTFLVKKPILWRMAYMSQQPRIVHQPYLWGCGNLIGKHINDLCAPFHCALPFGSMC
jgi:hypothetical protein